MIPNNKITTEYVEGEWLYDNYEEDLLYKHPGGRDLQNLTEEYTYQMWEMYYENNIIKLKALTSNKVYELKTVLNVTELSFCFTLNMTIAYLYKVGDIVYLNYYDTITQKYIEETFMNMNHAKLILDDSRITQTSSSDVIFFYINNITNKLCCRLLRDRYTIEYELQSVLKHTRLVRVGMANNLRLKFKLEQYD